MQDSPFRNSRPPPASRQQVVERAEAYLRAHVSMRVPLARLCRHVGVSERGLRRAFYDVRGISPRRYMLAQRLDGVRRALHEADGRPITVTTVATDYGFNELGRFAGKYRQAFGEAPSETLRGTHRRSA